MGTPKRASHTLLPAGLQPGPGVLVRVRGLLPSLAPAERRVGEAVLSNPAGVASQTITALARACQTSETTVIRFCRQVGFPGYPELRLALAAAASREAVVPGRAISSKINPEDDLADVVAKVAFADARAVEDTGAQLDPAVLGKVVDALVAARRVDVYATGASAFVAADLQRKLHRIGRLASAWCDAQAARCSAALLASSDVAVGISHTGTNAEVIAAVAQASRCGATTVALTNFPRSPLARCADLLLTTAARETTFRDGDMASRLAQLTVVDCVFVGVAQRNWSSARDALARTCEALREHHHRATRAEV